MYQVQCTAHSVTHHTLYLVLGTRYTALRTQKKMPFTFKRLNIPGIILIEPKLFQDSRGFFAEIYKQVDFAKEGLAKPIAQINYSKSTKGILRGLHYQKNPMAQAKFVQVIHGRIFDVAVDLRKDSPAYGKWIGETLSSQDLKILYIPEGLAHGFCVLSDEALITYYCTNVYSPDDERGVIWNDPELKIRWPLENPVVNIRDSKFPLFKGADNNFTYSVE